MASSSTSTTPNKPRRGDSTSPSARRTLAPSSSSILTRLWNRHISPSTSTSTSTSISTNVPKSTSMPLDLHTTHTSHNNNNNNSTLPPVRGASPLMNPTHHHKTPNTTTTTTTTTTTATAANDSPSPDGVSANSLISLGSLPPDIERGRSLSKRQLTRPRLGRDASPAMDVLRRTRPVRVHHEAPSENNLHTQPPNRERTTRERDPLSSDGALIERIVFSRAFSESAASSQPTLAHPNHRGIENLDTETGILSIGAYVDQMTRLGMLHPSADAILGLAVAYTDALGERHQGLIGPSNLHTLFLACLVLAAKYLIDIPRSNHAFATAARIQTSVLNLLELHVLCLLRFDLALLAQTAFPAAYTAVQAALLRSVPKSRSLEAVYPMEAVDLGFGLGQEKGITLPPIPKSVSSRNILRDAVYVVSPNSSSDDGDDDDDDDDNVYQITEDPSTSGSDTGSASFSQQRTLPYRTTPSSSSSLPPLSRHDRVSPRASAAKSLQQKPDSPMKPASTQSAAQANRQKTPRRSSLDLFS